MRKRTSFSWLAPVLSLLLVTVLLGACGPSSEGCVISGRVNGMAYEGRMLLLCDPYTHSVIDSVLVRDGKFSFGTVDRPDEVLQLRLSLSDDDLFPITLPVVTEKGRVETVLGELVLTSGTPLNDKLQDFLLAVDRFSDEVARPGKDIKEVREDFVRLLETSILQNRDNCVGAYIFRVYSSRLTPEQRASLLDKAGEALRKNIE